MKGTILIAKACTAALLISSAAWAENAGSVLDSSKLEEKKVTNAEGKELGEIQRLLIDPKTGAVRFAVLEVGGGLLQLPEREVVVPWETLKMTPKEEGDFDVRLNADKQMLENAPRFNEREAGDLFTPEGSRNLQSYWEASGMQRRDTTSTPRELDQQLQNDQLGTPLTPGGQIDHPNVITPRDPNQRTPKSYYQENRDRIQPSSEGQNNPPAGTQPADGNISGAENSPFRTEKQPDPTLQQEIEPQPGSGLEGQPDEATSFPDESNTVD